MDKGQEGFACCGDRTESKKKLSHVTVLIQVIHCVDHSTTYPM